MRVYQALHTGLPSVVTGVIALGAAWSLRGSAAGVEWLVAEGVGSGSVVAVSDPAAPLDVPVSYSLRVGQSAPTSAMFTRRLADGFADTVLTSVDGRSSVEVLWEGKAPGTLNPRA